MKYDVVIIGAGPGGIFSAYELMKQNNDLRLEILSVKDIAQLMVTK